MSEGYYITRYKQLTLHSVFQPIVTRNKTIIGVEALVRIYQADGSPLKPDLFFHSNRYSLSDKINVGYLSHQIHLHNFALSPFRALKLFLNTLPITAQSEAHDRQQEWQTITLAELDLAPEQIVMELVEMESDDDSLLQFNTQRLSRLGYHIAIDDFGVDASTDQRVALLTPDIIKFDRQLLTDYMSGIRLPLLNALTLARQTDTLTIAEGIENEQQFQAMLALNMDYYQGYYLGIPEAIRQTMPQVVGQ